MAVRPRRLDADNRAAPLGQRLDPEADGNRTWRGPITTFGKRVAYSHSACRSHGTRDSGTIDRMLA